MKTCSKCGLTKPLADYYRHPTGADGHMQTCKGCKKIYSSRRRVKIQTENPEVIQRYHRKYLSKYPLKRKAHVALNNAVRDKVIIRKPCEICGAVKAQAHHDDYLQWLEVRWLCVDHHKEWHSIHGEARNAA